MHEALLPAGEQVCTYHGLLVLLLAASDCAPTCHCTYALAGACGCLAQPAAAPMAPTTKQPAVLYSELCRYSASELRELGVEALVGAYKKAAQVCEQRKPIISCGGAPVAIAASVLLHPVGLSCHNQA